MVANMAIFWIFSKVRASVGLALAVALAMALPALAEDGDNAPLDLHGPAAKAAKTPKPKPHATDTGANSKDLKADKDEAKPTREPKPKSDIKPAADAKPTPEAKATADARPVADVKPTPDPKPSAEAKPTPAPSVALADKTRLTPQDVVAKANAYLEGMRVMTADFVQIGQDGARTDGNLYLSRPGKLLFRYNPPSPLEIVADGRSVAVRDQNLGTQDLYFIAQTPLKFLLSDHIDLAKDTSVKRVAVDDKSAMIEIEDKATFGGKSDITLVFDPDPFALKQWTVLDPQGFQTVVTLFDIDLISNPDPSLFHIDDSVPIVGAHRH
jgi:outer membrane lipoprotein-sorting protein